MSVHDFSIIKSALLLNLNNSEIYNLGLAKYNANERRIVTEIYNLVKTYLMKHVEQCFPTFFFIKSHLSVFKIMIPLATHQHRNRYVYII